MIGLTTVLAVVLGIPLGAYLWYVSPAGLRPAPVPYQVIGIVVNIVRSLPFVILVVLLIPATRMLVGTSLGYQAAVVPLTVYAVPFFARLVETAFREVSGGKIEASLLAGASHLQVLGKTIVPETLPSLVSAVTTTAIALIGASAMAGVLGGGGLGFLADAYGYKRWDLDVLLITALLLVILVQAVQLTGDAISRRLDHRAGAERPRSLRRLPGGDRRASRAAGSAPTTTPI
jgi:D-methionine transport system permease protein